MFVLSSMRSDCYDDSCPQSWLFLGHVVLKRGAKLSRVPLGMRLEYTRLHEQQWLCVLVVKSDSILR